MQKHLGKITLGLSILPFLIQSPLQNLHTGLTLFKIIALVLSIIIVTINIFINKLQITGREKTLARIGLFIIFIVDILTWFIFACSKGGGC